jgi:hypothetical protein
LTALVVLVILTIISLVGCQLGSNLTQTLATQTSLTEPINTPLPTHCDPITASNDTGLTILTLPDGSLIYLGPNTEIIFTPAGYCPGLEEHHILLKQGQVAISSKLPEGKLIQITSPDGYLAQVSKTGLVTFDPAKQSLKLDCTSGRCALGVAIDKLTALGCGESAVLDAAGNFSGPTAIDTVSLVLFGEWLLPKCGVIPAAVGTPDVAATATASCASFESQFPLTPCPDSIP